MVNERLKLIRKSLDMTQDQLAQRLGIGKAALSMIETGKAGLSTRNLNILVQEFAINPEWVEHGVGEMFTSRSATSKMSNVPNALNPQQCVPLYTVGVNGSLTSLFNEPDKHTPVSCIYIPNLPSCDGAISIVGDSMYPLLKSGDIVVYKQLNSVKDIFWGEMYLLSLEIDGDEYVTVKYIHKAEDPKQVKLVSQNLNHADLEVDVKRISAVAMVKASIRMNTIR